MIFFFLIFSKLSPSNFNFNFLIMLSHILSSPWKIDLALPVFFNIDDKNNFYISKNNYIVLKINKQQGVSQGLPLVEAKKLVTEFKDKLRRLKVLVDDSSDKTINSKIKALERLEKIKLNVNNIYKDMKKLDRAIFANIMLEGLGGLKLNFSLSKS